MSFKQIVKYQVGENVPLAAKFLTVYPICNEDEPVFLLYEIAVPQVKTVHMAENTIAEVVIYLNSVVKGKFTTKGSGKFIQARINEGFTYYDFVKVIDNKYLEWAGDPKWSMYLRPSTLFGTKFEAYLSQKGVDAMTDDAFAELENIMDKKK